MSQSCSSIYIIIVDDSPTVRMFIDRSLRATGRSIEIASAGNGEEALKLMKQRKFDIAFLDLQMPGLGGVEVMGAIKVMGGSTFAVAMSDELTEHNKAMLKSFGAYNFLKKPFSDAAVRGVLTCFDVIKSPQNVLIVDDSATVRKVVHKVLSRSIFNLNLVEAGDGASALEAVGKTEFGIIFSDFNMPNMTGIELAGKLAKDAANASVILMSTEFSQALNVAASAVGAKAFLKKPFYPEDVDTVLHHLNGLPHSEFGKSVKLFATV